MELDLTGLLKEVLTSSSPDLHLQVGHSPVVRLKTGDIAAMNQYPVLTKEQIEAVINSITSGEQKKQFEENLEADFSFSVEQVGRFRVNIYQERFGPAIAEADHTAGTARGRTGTHRSSRKTARQRLAASATAGEFSLDTPSMPVPSC